ncbi:MAG: hypothetical protein MUE34_18445, partial [Acidimicrobiales bacterium]|nr:hypothetical protein [Acidimicrobiales bacterium]
MATGTPFFAGAKALKLLVIAGVAVGGTAMVVGVPGSGGGDDAADIASATVLDLTAPTDERVEVEIEAGQTAVEVPIVTEDGEGQIQIEADASIAAESQRIVLERAVAPSRVTVQGSAVDVVQAGPAVRVQANSSGLLVCVPVSADASSTRSRLTDQGLVVSEPKLIWIDDSGETVSVTVSDRSDDGRLCGTVRSSGVLVTVMTTSSPAVAFSETTTTTRPPTTTTTTTTTRPPTTTTTVPPTTTTVPPVSFVDLTTDLPTGALLIDAAGLAPGGSLSRCIAVRYAGANSGDGLTVTPAIVSEAAATNALLGQLTVTLEEGASGTNA